MKINFKEYLLFLLVSELIINSIIILANLTTEYFGQEFVYSYYVVFPLITFLAVTMVCLIFIPLMNKIFDL